MQPHYQVHQTYNSGKKPPVPTRHFDINRIDAAEQSSIHYQGNDQSISREHMRLQEVGDQISPFHQSIKLDESTLSREQNHEKGMISQLDQKPIFRPDSSFTNKVG